MAETVESFYSMGSHLWNRFLIAFAEKVEMIYSYVGLNATDAKNDVAKFVCDS